MPLPGMQVDEDRHVLRQHFLVNGALVERMLAATAADRNARDPNVHALGIEFHAGAAGGGEDAAPVRIGAGERRLHQRRIRNRARDRSAARSDGAPRTSISITR